MNEVRVVVAGGSPVAQIGIVAALGEDRRLSLIGQAADTSEALARALHLGGNVLVLHASMLQTEVAHVMGQLIAVAAPIKVLVLAEHARRDEMLTALQTGVHGYGIVRYLAPEILCDGILTLAQHGAWLCPLTTRCLMRLVAHECQPRPAAAPTCAARLSEQELAVLRLAGCGANEQDIAEQLSLARNTVKTYLRRICEKLDVASRSDALRVAVQTGIIPDRRSAVPRILGSYDVRAAT